MLAFERVNPALDPALEIVQVPPDRGRVVERLSYPTRPKPYSDQRFVLARFHLRKKSENSCCNDTAMPYCSFISNEADIKKMNILKTGNYIEISDKEIPTGVRFDVPGRNQGQMVEVAYGGFARAEHDIGDPFKRVIDHSDGSVTFFRLAKC